MKILRKSVGLRSLVLIAVLQCMPEGKNISDLLNIYNRHDAGFSDIQAANFVTAFGVSFDSAGLISIPEDPVLALN